MGLETKWKRCYKKGGMQKAVWNTKQKGVLTFLIFKENSDYVAVCLNFDLVEYGKDPKKLAESIEEAALSYLEAVTKKDLSDEYLNIGTDKKYLEILKKLIYADELKKTTKKTKKAKVSSKQSYLEFKKLPYQGQNLITP